MPGVTATGAPSQLYQQVPLQEGTPYQNISGQLIDSVLIDNYSPSYLFIKCANRFCPPLTAGVVFKAVGNSNDESCTWISPQGVVAAATLNKGSALVIFTDRDVAESSGVPLLTPNQPVHLGNGAANATITVNPPPGANGLIVVLQAGGSPSASVRGVQSGQLYPEGGGQTVFFFPIDLGTDQSYQVTGTNAFSVDATFVIQSVAVNNGALNPIPIIIAGILQPFTNPTGLPIAGQIVGTTTNAIIKEYGNYLFVMQRPSMALVVNAFTLAANTGQTVITAPASGSEIVLRKIGISIAANPVASSVIELGTVSGGSTLGKWSVPLGTSAYPGEEEKRFDYDDYPIGDGLPVIVTATTAVSLSVQLTYSVVNTGTWPTS